MRRKLSRSEKRAETRVYMKRVLDLATQHGWCVLTKESHHNRSHYVRLCRVEDGKIAELCLRFSDHMQTVSAMRQPFIDLSSHDERRRLISRLERPADTRKRKTAGAVPPPNAMPPDVRLVREGFDSSVGGRLAPA